MATTKTDQPLYPDVTVEGIHMRQGMIDIGLERNSKKMQDFYNDVAKLYDEYSDTVGKDVGALNQAKAVESEQPDKQSRVLDVACGNGIVGLKLKELGYHNVDGLDFAQNMLDLCRSKNIYKNYICASIQPDKKTQVPDGTYDAVCMNGSMGAGHISSDAIPELARMVKPGGTVVFNITEYWVKNVAEFSEESIALKMQSLVDDGTLAKWTKKIQNYYAVTEEKAYFYISTVAYRQEKGKLM